jgi:hypothetical protein
MKPSSYAQDSTGPGIAKPRGVVLTMPKRQLLSLEEVLSRLESKSFPSKVALVLEWSLAGVAVRRTYPEAIQLRDPSS